jgi:hypothetical protein
MKRLSFALFLLFSFTYLTGQNDVSKDQLIQIKSKLEAKKKVIEDSIAIIDKEINKKEAQEFDLKFSNGMKFPTKANCFNLMTKEAEIFSEKVGRIYSGDSVEVLDYDPKTKYFYAKYHNSYGYIETYTVVLTDDLSQLIIKKDQDYESEKLQQEKHQALKNDQQKKEQALKNEQQAKQRKQNLINKYGQVNAEKILAGKIWIGMTKEMAIESWGKPEDINRTVTSYSVSEQWVYGERYLYFDDGILTSWQD